MEQLVHSKVLEYIVLPKEPGVYSLQPSFAFFDPDSNHYCIKTTQRIDFQVSAGKNYQPKSVYQDSIALLTPAVEPISTDWKRWLGSPVLWGWSGVLLVALAGIFFWKKRQKKAPFTGPNIKPLAALPSKGFRERFAAIPQLLQAGPAPGFL